MNSILDDRRLQGVRAVRKVTISDCVGRVRQQPAAEQKQTAALFNISLSRYPSTYCNRLINAYASGRITYKDYVALGSSTADNSKVIRIMQGDQSSNCSYPDGTVRSRGGSGPTGAFVSVAG